MWGTEENSYKVTGVLLTYHIFMMLWMWSVIFNMSFTIMAHTVAQWFYTIQSPQVPRSSRDRAEIEPRSSPVDDTEPACATCGTAPLSARLTVCCCCRPAGISPARPLCARPATASARGVSVRVECRV